MLGRIFLIKFSKVKDDKNSKDKDFESAEAMSELFCFRLLKTLSPKHL